MSDTWEVVVGNVGTVYRGFSEVLARRAYANYCTASYRQEGKASGESVTLLVASEIVSEYPGRLPGEQP